MVGENTVDIDDVVVVAEGSEIVLRRVLSTGCLSITSVSIGVSSPSVKPLACFSSAIFTSS